MDDADDFDAVLHGAIENDVGLDDQMAQARPDVLASRAELRVLGELPAARVDLVEQAIRRRRVVGGDVTPEIDQVLAGATRATDTRHGSAVRLPGGALEVLDRLVRIGGSAREALVP